MKKGITLVALVVTIIILLILATVTISLILGENSLFGRAEEGKIKTEMTQLGERIQSAATAVIMDLTVNPTGTNVSNESNIKSAIGAHLSSTDSATFSGFTYTAPTPPSTVHTFVHTQDTHTLTFTVDFDKNAIDYEVSK